MRMVTSLAAEPFWHFQAQEPHHTAYEAEGLHEHRAPVLPLQPTGQLTFARAVDEGLSPADGYSR